MENYDTALDTRQRYLIKISAFAAKSNVPALTKTCDSALEAGLTISEIKEALVHIVAYAGFPPSILGINTFKQVVDARAAAGKKDEQGRGNSPIEEGPGIYKRGEKTQIIVTGLSAETLKGLFDFAPVMDVFLKEHLFGDLFDRDILSYMDRELLTVACLAAQHHPFVRSHIGGALNVGVTTQQLLALLDLIEGEIGTDEADTGRKVLDEVLLARK
jgi:alkylhydroperoxidase/carboxymuconolactone decarboxylase family protein YurZ